jgi:protein CpxP
MNRIRKQLAIAGLLAGLGLGAVAQQQPAPAPQGHDGTSMGHRGRMMDPGEMQARMAERMQRRMTAFKQRLQITPAQEGAWTNWTNAMKPPANMQRPNREEIRKLPTPERIDRMRALRQQRIAEMDRRGEATKQFYGQLSAEQKKTFDESSSRLMRGGRHHGGGMRGHGGPHGR